VAVTAVSHRIFRAATVRERTAMTESLLNGRGSIGALLAALNVA
jgi:hypothetical protein